MLRELGTEASLSGSLPNIHSPSSVLQGDSNPWERPHLQGKLQAERSEDTDSIPALEKARAPLASVFLI